MAVGTAAVFRLIETGATNLTANVSYTPPYSIATICLPCVDDSIYTRSQFAGVVQAAVEGMAFAVVAGMAVHTSAAPEAARDTGLGVGVAGSASRDLVEWPGRLVESVCLGPCQHVHQTIMMDRWRP